MFTITEGAPTRCARNKSAYFLTREEGFHPTKARIPPSITELHERCNFARTTAGVHVHVLVCNLLGRMPQRKASLQAHNPTHDPSKHLSKLSTCSIC